MRLALRQPLALVLPSSGDTAFHGAAGSALRDSLKVWDTMLI